MTSPQIADALLTLETRKSLSPALAALILGAVSQVESLIELAERVCDPVFRHPHQDDDRLRLVVQGSSKRISAPASSLR